MKKAAIVAILAMLALTTPRSSFAHEYSRDDEGHPLRLIAYIFHPLGIALEKFIYRPVHNNIIESDAELLGTPAYEWFGHVPVDKHDYEPIAAAPAPEIVYQEVPVEVIREVYVTRELERFEIAADLLFAPGKDVLTDEGKGRIDAAVAEIQAKYPGKRLNIEGHTDTDPIVESNWKSNWELGAARGLAVLHYLEDQHGVQGNLMSSTTYSYHQPVAGNETSEGKAMNRRAAIVIYADEADEMPAAAAAPVADDAPAI